MKVTYYRSLFDPKSGEDKMVRDIIKLIQTDHNLTWKTERLRQMEGDAYKAEKNSLPLVTFSGTFKKRSKQNLIEHSGLICLDFDDVDVKEQRERLSKCKYCLAHWISPGGKGVKALMKIEESTWQEHDKIARSLFEEWPNADVACKDVSRACFLSHDSTIVVNWAPSTYKPAEKEIPAPKPERIKAMNTFQPSRNWFECYKWLKEAHGEAPLEGSRHDWVNRMIGSAINKGMPQDELYNLLARDILDSTYSEKELEDQIGPLYREHSADFNKEPWTEKGSRTHIEVLAAPKSESSINILRNDPDAVMEPKTASGVDLDSVFLQPDLELMKFYMANGIPQGERTGIEAVDKRWRLAKGEITVIFGLPNHGKSELINMVLMNRALIAGEKFMVFSPESEPVELWAMNLVNKYFHSTVRRREVKSNAIEQALDFINRHFFFINPNRGLMDAKYLYSQLEELGGVDGIVIDPYNRLHTDLTERDDKVVAGFLQEAKIFAQRNRLYFIIGAHTNASGGMENKEKEFDVPYYRKLANGAMWGNMADNCIAVHRPWIRTKPEDTTTIVETQKIKKHKVNGWLGQAILRYDTEKEIYHSTDLDRFSYNEIGIGLGAFDRSQEFKSSFEYYRD